MPSHPPDPLSAEEAAAGPPPGDPVLQQSLAAVVAVVARLRDPDLGCPWDLQQSHQTLLPYALEEAHELADAIRHGDDRQLREELGDLLLQVLLHAQIAGEQGRFDLAAVADGLRDKLVRRHPHVFGPGAAALANRGRGGDAAAVRTSWEAIKAVERLSLASDDDPAAAPDSGFGADSPLTQQLARRVRGQAPLAGAMQISQRAAAAGFEWEHIDGVWAKVHEELEELRQALEAARHGGDPAAAQEELGDVLFTLVNVARWCGLDPEAGLAGTNRRFLERFARVEAALGGELRGRSLAELENHWQHAKAQIRAERRGPEPELT